VEEQERRLEWKIVVITFELDDASMGHHANIITLQTCRVVEE